MSGSVWSCNWTGEGTLEFYISKNLYSFYITIEVAGLIILDF